MSEEGFPVKVYVYDISKGMARTLSPAFIGKQIDGVWHTGIVAYGQEFYFGGSTGIETCPPAGTILGQPDSIVDLGRTQVPQDMFMDYLHELSQSSFSANRYHLLDHNCNNFSAEVAQFLTGQSIPAHITNLPAEVLSTPLGAMLKPLIDSMSVQPDGGHALFPSDSNSQNPPGTGSQAASSSSSSSPATSSTDASETSQKKTMEKKIGLTDYVSFNPSLNFLETSKIEEIKKQLRTFLSQQELTVWQEITKYLSTNECSWSLGRPHLEILGKILCSMDVAVDVKVQTCELLQLLVLNSDFLNVVAHDPSHMLGCILRRFEEQTIPVKTCTIKVLVNCLTTECGRAVIHKAKGATSESPGVEKQATRLCVTCLLDVIDQDLLESASALALNISLNKVDDDTAVEVGSAIIQILQQDLRERTALYCLSSLYQIMKHSSEVQALAGVMGVNWSRLSSISTEVQQICERVQAMTTGS